MSDIKYLTIIEAQGLKTKLENNIYRLIQEFESDTKCKIDAINLYKIDASTNHSIRKSYILGGIQIDVII